MRIFAWGAALLSALWAAFVLLVLVLAWTGASIVTTDSVVTPVPRPVEPTVTATVVASTGGEDDFQGLPPGTGRDEVLGLCGACHSMKLVTQQGLSRATWEEVLEFMVEEQEMSELEPEDEMLVLDYLEKFYGPDRLAKSMETETGTTPGIGQPPGDGAGSRE